LACRIREALVVCVNRLKEDKLAVNEQALFSEVDNAIDEFKKKIY